MWKWPGESSVAYAEKKIFGHRCGERPWPEPAIATMLSSDLINASLFAMLAP
jgi:hypothetical protein